MPLSLAICSLPPGPPALCLYAGDTGGPMTLDERRSAEQVWLRRTTFRLRRDVMKHLKRGRMHPDPELASRAYRWAKGAGGALGCRGDRHIERECLRGGVVVGGVAFEGERDRGQAVLLRVLT